MAKAKGHWTKKPNMFGLITGIVISAVSVWMAIYSEARPIYAYIYILLGVESMIRAFWVNPEPPKDSRPMEEQYEELLQEYSNEQLEKILNDSLRSDEIKQAVQRVLKGRNRTQ